MALNPDRIGHTYPPYRYEVSREKLREYAQATGIDDPAYTADPAELPLAHLVAPPTFAACFSISRLGDVVGDPELGAHPRLVHGAQEFDLHRPIRGGDVLECTPRIRDVTVRGRLELLTYDVEAVDARTREPVVTSSSTIVFLPPDETPSVRPTRGDD
jgi:hypothetical protein